MNSRAAQARDFLTWVVAFIVSIYTVSNLMPLLLHAATRGFGSVDGLWIVGYSIALTVAILILARGIYRLDKRAGRIRNKVGWFE